MFGWFWLVLLHKLHCIFHAKKYTHGQNMINLGVVPPLSLSLYDGFVLINSVLNDNKVKKRRNHKDKTYMNPMQSK